MLSGNVIEKTLFGPLDKQYCLYFYILTVLGFIFALMMFFYFLYLLYAANSGSNIAKRSGLMLQPVFISILTYIVFYFQNRILYSMCIGQSH